MFLVQRVFTRPNAEVAFYQATEEFRNHYRTAYRETGLFLSNTVTISPDRLKQVISTMWADEATWEAYKADSICQAHFTARNAYNDANGITGERTTAEL